MFSRIVYRINAALEPRLPEQRVFLRSDVDTRFVRLSPLSQLFGGAAAVLLIGWLIVATAVLLMDQIGATTGREQAQTTQALYEKRMAEMSADRNARAEEASRAQERFNLALAQVAVMQERLLASEDRRRELETGIDVIQSTLRRTIQERDAARADATKATDALVKQTGSARDNDSALRDTLATLQVLADQLGATASQRDASADDQAKLAAQVAEVEGQKAEIEHRNDVIFSRLEEALTVSVEPLDKMFRQAGLKPDDLIAAVRRGYSGQGGPLGKISFRPGTPPSADELRANAILDSLDRVNLYRIAAFKSPFSMPVKAAFRFTSGFGSRDDPMGRGRRMHEGQDLAGAYGTPIFATADGVVTFAGWENGYGRLIKIRHAFGIETRYGHLSQIRVDVGDHVSRGDRIGDMGNSGRSTGTHLHYEVRLSGRAVNPMTFIRAARNVF